MCTDVLFLEDILAHFLRPGPAIEPEETETLNVINRLAISFPVLLFKCRSLIVLGLLWFLKTK